MAGVFLSSAGLLVRLVESADAWTVLFYRSIAFTLTVLVFMAVRESGRVWPLLRSYRRYDLLVSVSLACGFIFYVLSLYHTSVANTVLLLSTGPFFTALLGWVFLRERVGLVTWLAMAGAAAGIAVMVSGGLTADDIAGMVYALLAVAGFAAMVVALRVVSAKRDMLAATAFGGILAACACVPFVQSFMISPRDLLVSLLLGSVQVGFGFILITLASRSVPSAQVPLLALGETALAPLWVWLFVGEVPAVATLAGGAIVLLAVFSQGIAGVMSSSAATTGD
jgi:drug/metabolite transporter (DMT)-like permease